MGRKKKEEPVVKMYKGMWGLNSRNKPKWWTSIWDIIEMKDNLLIAETKETYHHEGTLTTYGEVKFDYKYVVVCCYGLLTMYLVPMYSSLHGNYKIKVQEHFDFDEYNLKLRKLDQKASTVLQVFTCPIVRDRVEYKFPIINGDLEMTDYMGIYLTQVGVALPMVDKLIEYDLDRTQEDNQLTGKEIIIGLLFGIDSFIENIL